jgi:hypothetical protein
MNQHLYRSSKKSSSTSSSSDSHTVLNTLWVVEVSDNSKMKKTFSLVAAAKPRLARRNIRFPTVFFDLVVNFE